MNIEAPEISKQFTGAWYDAGEKEDSAMLDVIRLNAEQTSPGIFVNTMLNSAFEDAYLCAKKAINVAINMTNPILPYVTKDVPHFSATPEYLLEDDPVIGVITWVNVHVILEQGEAAFRRVMAAAKAEIEAWKEAEKGNYGPLRQIQARERFEKHLPSYRTSSLKLDEGSKSIRRLLQQKDI